MADAYQLTKLIGNPLLEAAGMLRMTNSKDVYCRLLDAFVRIVAPSMDLLKTDNISANLMTFRKGIALVEKMGMSIGAVEIALIAAKADIACIENRWEGRDGAKFLTEVLAEHVGALLALIRGAATGQPLSGPAETYAETEGQSPAIAMYKKAPSDRRRILAVDDMGDQLNTMRLLFRNTYYFTGIIEPLQALKFLMNNDIDVIVMDIEMPEIDGCSLLSLIRKNQYLANIPVIFLTGNANANNVWAARNSGGADFIKKPLNTITLMKRIEKLFGVDYVE